VHRILIVRIAAVLLLLIAGAEAYACDLSDACIGGNASSRTDCDGAGGDNCLCCCHHVVPVAAFTLTPGVICQEPAPEPVIQLLSASLPIDHPPQL